jgi:F-type H+-transporting ATPase subunit gamma
VSLIEVKQQIKSTKNTKKITKAMQLVAASKMKKFQKVALNSREFSRMLVSTLRLSGGSIAETSFGNSSGEKKLFVLLTSDKGLCGAMNTRLLRVLFKGDLWQGLADDEKDLITIGKKSSESAKYMGIRVMHSYNAVTEEMTPLEALKIIDKILEAWETGEYGEVYLVSPWYVNPFVFNARAKKMLPLSNQMMQEYLTEEGIDWQRGEEVPDTVLFEPSRERVAEGLALQIVRGMFTEAFYQLKATEYSSRMVAMKKATEAADDQIKILTGKFNKARQAAITQQLAELASASEAMSTQNAYEIFE